MKRICCATALSFLLLGLSGYAAQSVEELPEGTVRSDDRVSVNSRDIVRTSAELPDALLGQWITADGRTRYFFGRKRVTVIHTLLAHGRSPRTYEQTMRYEVTAINPDTGWLQMELQTPSGWAQVRSVRFATDRQTVTESIHVLGHYADTEWTYVDNLEQPLQAEQETELAPNPSM